MLSNVLLVTGSNGAKLVSETAWFGHTFCKFCRSDESSDGSDLPEPPKSNSLGLNVKHWAKPKVCAPAYSQYTCEIGLTTN